MSVTIKDGGSGNIASVNIEGRLFTNSIQISDDTAKAQNGDAYLVNSTDATLTSDNESATFYFKNNEDRDVIITKLAIALGFSTGGAATELVIASVVRNPTGGTVISEAVNALVGNRNFGSNNSITVDAFVGGEGKTLTGGTVLISNRAVAPGIGILDTPLVLTKGSSVGVKIAPTTGNTSMLTATALDIHLDGFSETT